MYVDEVGNADLRSSDDPNHRFLSLTGVVIGLSHVESVVHPQMEGLKSTYFGSHPDDPVILHRKELVNRRGPFACLRKGCSPSAECAPKGDDEPEAASSVTQSRRSTSLRPARTHPNLAAEHRGVGRVWCEHPQAHASRCFVTRFASPSSPNSRQTSINSALAPRHSRSASPSSRGTSSLRVAKRR